LERFEAEQQMTYMTSIERIGRAQTLQESIAEVLEARFNNVPSEFIEQLKKIYELDRLKQLLKQSIITSSISEFQQQLSQENTGTEF
jgi:flagella basal body P-ring formation protein FlgA